MSDAARTNKRLVEALDRLHVHDHPVLIFETSEEKVDVVAPFIKVGFERGERCLIFAPETSKMALLEELASAGIDTAAVLASGALSIPDIQGMYGRDEPFNPDRVLEFLDRAITDAKSDGHTGLRLVGDMPWTLEGTSGAETLLEYEAKLDEFIRSHDLPTLCLYDRNLFPPNVLLDVLHTHPKVITRHVMSKNYAYLPPYHFFHPDWAESGVDNLLQGLLSNEELIAALEKRTALLNAVVDNSPDIIYVKDLEGRYLMINPAGAAFFDKSVEELLGKTVNDFLSAEDAAAVIEADRKTYASDRPLSMELTYTISGIVRTCLVIKGVYRDAKGEVIGLFGISRDITDRKHAEAEIIKCQEDLRFLATEMSQREEQERHGIASALHDQIGQTLALAKVRLELMTLGNDVREDIGQVCGLLDDAIRQTRSLTLEISSPILYELGFEAAVQSLCNEFQSRYGIRVDFRDSRKATPLPDALRSFLYQGVRELLVNVVKHAKATIASVTCEKDGANIRVTVTDNGRGFDTDKEIIRAGNCHGFGLFSLRERLKFLGGEFSITSVPERGTQVTLVTPLAGEDNAAYRCRPCNAGR